jgi:ABC-type glutathione transport system ATPase component
MGEVLLEVVELRKEYFQKINPFLHTGRIIKAVNGVSFKILRGEAVGLAGESGSGKTTLALLIVRLIEPTQGRVYYRGYDVFSLRGRALLKFRREVQIIFQDPDSSLNPRMKIRKILEEPLRVHKLASSEGEIKEKINYVLEKVGLEQQHLERYPHELSGGQRQRVAIARALILNPEFLVLDEPTSALDVLTQKRILELLKRLRKELGITYLLVSHDLGVIKELCDRVMILRSGRIVEEGPTSKILNEPSHPYTQILLRAIPRLDPDMRSILSHEWKFDIFSYAS